MKKVNILITVFVLIFIYFFHLEINKKDVLVAVIDSGMKKNHPLLYGKVKEGFDFVDFDKKTDDENGHGTHMAGIIAQNAPKASILSVRVLDEKGDGNGTIPLGILYAVMRGANIVNLSLKEDYNPLTEIMIEFGKRKGVIFVAASGNDGEKKVSYPANYNHVISVAAFDERNGRIYKKSNIDASVDFFAPGVYVRSGDIIKDYTYKSGTSVSAAYISGVIAYLEEEKSSYDEEKIYKKLKKNAVLIERREKKGILMKKIKR